MMRLPDNKLVLTIVLGAASFVGTGVANAQVTVFYDSQAEGTADSLLLELEGVGIHAKTRQIGRDPERSLERASYSEVRALVWCAANPPRIEVHYPEQVRRGEGAALTTSSAPNNLPASLIEVTEVLRSERFVAVPPEIFRPERWWIGVEGNVLLTPGGLAPLGSITLAISLRLRLRWSLELSGGAQVHAREKSVAEQSIRVRADQVSLAGYFHPLVRSRIDLGTGIAMGALRFSVKGSEAVEAAGAAPVTWTAWPHVKVLFRVRFASRFWFRFSGSVGALAPMISIGDQAAFGAAGPFVSQLGVGVEAAF